MSLSRLHEGLENRNLLGKTVIEADRLQDTQPDDPAMALVLWMNSEVSLYQADELAWRYTRGDNRVSEMIVNQIRCTNDTYIPM